MVGKTSLIFIDHADLVLASTALPTSASGH